MVVRFEVAGVSGNDLKVNVEGRRLRIRGVRRTPRSAAIDRLHQMEISFGPFERSLEIETAFDPGAVRARLEDGLLEVRLPKQAPRKRQLEIESGD